MKEIRILNSVKGDLCKTIKTEYKKAGWSSMFRNDGFAMTGIMEITKRQDKIRFTQLPNGNIRGYLDDEKKTGVSEMQYTNPENVSPTVTTAQVPKVLEPQTCAFRGRNPEDLSDRSKGSATAQICFVGGNVANCITTVSKDSMVAEPKVKQVGNLVENSKFDNPQRGRVYSDDGIAPAMNCCGGGNRKPKIVSYSRDKKGKVVDRHLKDIANTVHTATGSGGNTDSFVAEPNVLSPKRTAFGKAVRKDYENHKVSLKRNDMREYEPKTDGKSNIITTVAKDNILAEPEKDMDIRIRKLTEREVFRLMDVDEPYIDRIGVSGVSRGKQYFMAGNSIVVACMEHIFRKLLINPEIEPDENGQMSLF